jgi:ABC-type transport system involved in Fe-S cluster assembly fused permease/ATPase subunit
MRINPRWSIAILLVIYILLFRFRNIIEGDLFSDIILALTALIILWYTVETHIIRKSEQAIAKSNEILLKKTFKPVVAFKIINQFDNDPLETGFYIENLSEYQIAARVKIGFTLAQKHFKNVLPDYNGKLFWNLQHSEIKEGHFSLYDLMKREGLISSEMRPVILSQDRKDQMREFIIQYQLKNELSDSPILKMKLEVYCQNDQNESIYYLPTFFELNPFMNIWIPKITSKEPFWEFNRQPDWV